VRADTFTCDVCGKDRRRDANHWWLIRLVFTRPTDGPQIDARLWDERLADEDDSWAHICGMDCLGKQFGRYAERVMSRRPIRNAWIGGPA
jgi:hypothetical protein